jgi:branched-chain amino acid transport system substrate-binding protein
MTSLTVGAALAQTGIYALQGQQALQGLRLWVENTNAQGGLFVPELRRQIPLQLLTHDDHSRRADVERLVERLLTSDRVHCLIGPYSSGLTQAAAAVAEGHQKVLWNHGGSSDAIMQQGFRWAIHLPTPASGYLSGLFACLLQHGARAEPVAIVQRRRGTFAAEVASGARQQAERHAFSLLPTFFYPEDVNQIPALARELSAAGPGLIILVGRFDDDVMVAHSLAENLLTLKTAAAVATPMQAFWGDLRERADGWIGPSQWELGAEGSPDVGPSSAAFVERFRRRFGQLPDYPAAQAYAAGLIFQHCVSLAGSCDDASLHAAAAQLSCRTFYGDFRLDPETGIQVGHETVLVQWHGEEKKVIWPAGMAEARLMYPKPSAPPLPLGED